MPVNSQRKQGSPTYYRLEEVPGRSGTLGLCLQCHLLSRDPVLIPFALSTMSCVLCCCYNSRDLEFPRQDIIHGNVRTHCS